MGYYDSSENVEKYIRMCKDYNGSHLYQFLAKHLEDGKSLLELGSGPGFDIAFLSQHYQVTGSDLSEQFLDHCRKKFTDIPFIKLNTLALDIESRFDCVYSNKVLHHLTEEQLKDSLAQQCMILREGGIIAHTFWMGDENQEMEGLLFTYYRKEKLVEIISEHFEVIAK